MRRNLKSFFIRWLAICLLINFHCQKPRATSLEIGLKMNIELMKQYKVVDSDFISTTGPSDMYRLKMAETGGSKLHFYTDENQIIRFIGAYTKDFLTPEGLKIGDTLNKVLQFSDKGLYWEKGWSFFVELRSGWFATIDSPHKRSPNINSKVTSFFKKDMIYQENFFVYPVKYLDKQIDVGKEIDFLLPENNVEYRTLPE